MDHFAEYSGVVLILLVGAFVLFGHWLACMWFAIGKCAHLFPGYSLGTDNFLEIVDSTLFIGINTICGKNNQLSSHNWLVKFAEDTNQQFEIRTDKITSIRTG